MFQSKWRLWNISITILVFLTAYNIFLTVKWMYSTPCVQNSQGPIVERLKIDLSECSNKNSPKLEIEPMPNPPKTNKTVYDNFAEIYKNLQLNQKYSLNLNLGLGRSDNRLAYKLFDNVIVGEKFVQLTEIYKTSLATQSSLDKIASLIESSLYWGGPISLAAFAGNERELNHLLLYIIYLRKCNIRIREKVTFHVAIMKEKGPKQYSIDEERLEKMDCENPMGVLHGLLRELNKREDDKISEKNGIEDGKYPLDFIGNNLRPRKRAGINQWRYKLPYPQNLLRNLARKNCHTKYIFLTDVDIIPSRGMAESLNEFLDNEKCAGQCAYVVPTYELDERVLFPPNKTDLIRMANKGLARPFHHKVFIYNQYATNFSRWQTFKDSDEKVRISHPVTNFEFLYEPFYIATDTVPAHDERFVGYGYTRNSQVYEMFVAGYEFFVLSPIFTCHWGLQVKKSRPPWREHQNNQNRKQFDHFKKEIFARYNKDPLNMMAPKN